MNEFKQQLIDLIKAWEIPTSNHYHDSVIMSECHNCKPEPKHKFQQRPIIQPEPEPEPNMKIWRKRPILGHRRFEPECLTKHEPRPIIERRCLNPIQDLTNPIHEAKRKEDQFKKDLKALHDMIMKDTKEKEQRRPKMGWCPCCTCHSCFEK
jgi:hypothetical protein